MSFLSRNQLQSYLILREHRPNEALDWPCDGTVLTSAFARDDTLQLDRLVVAWKDLAHGLLRPLSRSFRFSFVYCRRIAEQVEPAR